jgi:hypothetical protein
MRQPHIVEAAEALQILSPPSNVIYLVTSCTYFHESMNRSEPLTFTILVTIQNANAITMQYACDGRVVFFTKCC